MTKLKTLFLSLFLVLFSQIFAQSVQIPTPKKIWKVSSGHIISNGDIKGYYVLTKSDKADKNSHNYTLRIFDENLDAVVSKEITKPKKLYLAEASFNGKAFLLLFVNLSQKIVEFESYDINGNKLGSTVYEKMKVGLDRYRLSGILSIKNLNPTINPIKNRGFIWIKILEKGSGIKVKYSSVFEYLPNNLDPAKKWNVEEAKGHEILKSPKIYSHDDLRAQILAYRKNELDKKNSFYNLQHISLDEGKLLFEKDLEEKEYKLSPSYSKYLAKEDKVLTVGNYADIKAQVGKSLGLFFQVHDSDGNKIKSSYISWEEDFSKFLDVNAKGRLKGGGYIMIHDILTPENGRTYLVGEKFRVPSVSFGQPKAFLEDILIIELDEELKLAEINAFEKKKTDVFLPENFASIHSMSQYLKDHGWYDYAFTQIDENKNSFVVAFTSINGAINAKTGPIVGFIVFDEKNGFSDHYISLNAKANYNWTKPAKKGFVSIWEYHSKQKSINIKLEPIE